MKKPTLVFLMSTLLLAGHITLFAAPEMNPRAMAKAVVIGNGQSIRVIYKSQEPADVRVSIQDGSGQMVFSEKIRNSDGFIRPYDLQALPGGDYTVSVEDPSFRYSSKFTVSMMDNDHPLVASISMVGRPEEHRFLVAIPNITNRENRVNVKIYRGGNQLLYDRTESVIFPKAILYRVTDLPPGEDDQITIEVTDQRGVVNVKSF